MNNISSNYIENEIKKLTIYSRSNNQFEIQFINKIDYLYIIAINNNIIYEKKVTLDEIKEVKLFFDYNNIHDCLNEIYNGINPNQKYSLKCNIEEKSSNIILNIPLRNKKFKEIIFILNIKQNEEYEEKDSIINSNDNFSYNQINEQLQNQEIEIKQLEIKNKQIENKLNSLILLNNKFKKNIKLIIEFEKKEKKNITQLINGINIDSKILKDKLEYKISLKKWINPYNPFTIELLFRLSKDIKKEENNIKKFHDKCDKISPTLILIESMNGKKFGGYTTCTWDGLWENKNDGQTFLFSFDKNKKFKKKFNCIDNKDIYANKSCGPWFGGNDLYFENNMQKCNSNLPYSFLENNDLVENNNMEFGVKEVEIYKIVF